MLFVFSLPVDGMQRLDHLCAARHDAPLAPPPCLQVHSALLRWLTGDPGAGIHTTNYPLPVIHGEQSMRINEQSGRWPATGPP